MKAIWNGKVIAESNDTINVEGNQYFPEESVQKEFLTSSETHTVCHWKGTASYYDIVVDGQTNKDAAWYYPEPSELAKSIIGHIAFWRGVEVISSNENHTWKQLTLDFNKDLNNVLIQQHHAAQFIALAGRHLIPQKPDDSNTNLQYLTDREWLIGNELPGGMWIALSLPDLKLIIHDKQDLHRSESVLAGKSKKQVFDQLKQNLSDLGLDVSKFTNELHYTLPDHELDKNAAFSTDDQKYIQENILYRHNAEIVLIEIAAKYKKAEPVRIWPHHFDTGSFVPLEINADGGTSKSIGLGWAIPDSMVNEPYYYLSYWSETTVDDFNELPDPETGEWIRTGWNGGVVRNADIVKISSARGQQEFVELFFNSGIKILSEHYNF